MAHELKESDIRKQIFDYLQKRNIFCWHDRQSASTPLNGNFRSSKGVADILGIYKGKPLAIEVKRPGGEVSTVQFHWLDRFRREGGISMMCTSVEEVQRQLAEVK